MSTIKASKQALQKQLCWRAFKMEIMWDLCLWMKDSIKSFNFISIFFVKYTLPIPMVHTSTWQVLT